MSKRMLLVFMFGLSTIPLFVSSPIGAVPETQSDLKNKVLILVEQLGNPAKQVSAETELLKLGPDVLAFLPGPDAKLSPAQKERLKTIRTTLQEALVLKEMGPRLVNLQNDAIPLSQALDQLHKQTELLVEDRRKAGTDNPTLKLNLQKATFWQALDAIAKEADLQISLFERDGKLAIVDGPHRAQQVCYSGMFRIAFQRITNFLDFQTEAHYCQVHLEIAWEPRFQPLFLQSKPESIVVHDDKGVGLTVPENGNNKAPLQGQLSTEVQMTFQAPRRSALKLGMLKGVYEVTGPVKMLDFVFDKLAKVDKRTPKEQIPMQVKEGVSVKLREFTTESDLWTVGFLLEYPPDGPEFESFESWLVNNQIHLEDKQGKRFPPGGYEIDEESARRAVVTYRFVEENGLVLGKPENWKLLYRTPGLIAKVPIQFEFKDLPLP